MNPTWPGVGGASGAENEQVVLEEPRTATHDGGHCPLVELVATPEPGSQR